MRENLQRYAVNVKRAHSPTEPMGIGLWLSSSAAARLMAQDAKSELAQWFHRAGLVPFTFNGFPYGDFHQRVVKHRVYHPTWFEPDRLQYTLNLVQIMHALLPDGMEGSISTLPLAWGRPPLQPAQWQQAAQQLLVVAQTLAKLYADRGRLIYLCLEPEPGCCLQYGNDVIRFFEDYLLRDGNEEQTRRHLRVCHDVCHAAVMFEDQRQVLDGYDAHGIRVGKVQVSSAVRLDLTSLDDNLVEAAMDQLAGFDEQRYLHQTVICTIDDQQTFYEDLPAALQWLKTHRAQCRELRVHFHVPIYLEEFGCLSTSQADIRRCIEATRADPELLHYEVETYAWSVLPAELAQPDLVQGIAAEMRWLDRLLSEN
jgi:hypothetical protein